MAIERQSGSTDDSWENDPNLFQDGLASVMGGRDRNDILSEFSYLENDFQAFEETTRAPAHLVSELVNRVKELEINDPTRGLSIDDKTQEDLLTIVDDLAGYPEAMKEFLEHPAIEDSPMFENPPVLEVLPGRHWKKQDEGYTVTPIRLLAFALKRSNKPFEVVMSFADSLAPEVETQIEGLEVVKEQSALLGLTAEEYKQVDNEVAKAITMKKAVIAAVKAAALAEKEEKARKEEAKSREREEKRAEEARLAVEWEKLSNDLIDDPEATYRSYLQGNRHVYEESTLAPLSVSSRYLSATNGEGEADNTAEAMSILNNHLYALVLAYDKKLQHLSGDEAFTVIKPHLHRFYPDMESLEKLVAEFPRLRWDGEFFAAWKKARTDDLVRKDAEALVGKFGPQLLGRQDITKLTIHPNQYLGVPYNDQAEIIRDLKKYFCDPIDDRDAEDLPDWSKSNKVIVKNISEDLLNHSNAKYTPRGDYRYRNGTSDVKKEQIFKISSDKSLDGKPFHLMLSQLHNYAAFFGKGVVYCPEAEVTISMKLAPAAEMPEADMERLQNSCEELGKSPQLDEENIWVQKKPTESTESFSLGYGKKPNQTVIDLLRKVLGDDTEISYYLDTHDTQIQLAGEKVAEADQALKVTSYVESGKQTRKITRECVATFKITATAEQTKLLEALKAALPQSREPLPDMLY